MPTLNDTRTDPQTGEPEIYTATGWVTDWAALGAPAPEMDLTTFESTSPSFSNFGLFRPRDLLDRFGAIRKMPNETAERSTVNVFDGGPAVIPAPFPATTTGFWIKAEGVPVATPLGLIGADKMAYFSSVMGAAYTMSASDDSGPSVERVVTLKNPGFGTILGDFNFMMPGGGSRSIQILSTSGAAIAYTDFNTYWSAGAGGANDAALTGVWDGTWRYARGGVHMTAAQQYQHVEFSANGWFYHAQMTVGPAYNGNRFSLTRWKK